MQGFKYHTVLETVSLVAHRTPCSVCSWESRWTFCRNHCSGSLAFLEQEPPTHPGATVIVKLLVTSVLFRVHTRGQRTGLVVQEKPPKLPVLQCTSLRMLPSAVLLAAWVLIPQLGTPRAQVPTHLD